MSERRVLVEVPASSSSSMSLQKCRTSFGGTQQPSSPLESTPSSRANVRSDLIPLPVTYTEPTPIGCIADQGSRVTCRAMGISSVFLQGLQSSGLAIVPTPGLDEDHGVAEDLRSCLVEYMAKVRTLEQVSRELEAELRTHMESRRATTSGGWGALRASWTSSCQQVGEAVLENARLILQTDNVQAGADDFKERYENEQRFRKTVEEEINSLYQVIDEANLTKMDLESQIGNLKEELGFLARNYEEDVKVLYKQLAGSELEQIDVPIGTGLDNILETIRICWERDAERNRLETRAWLQAKVRGRACNL